MTQSSACYSSACSMLVGKSKHESECGKKKPGEEREKGRGEVFRLVSPQPSHVFNGGRVKIAGKLGSAPVCLACIAGVKRRQRKERKDTELER